MVGIVKHYSLYLCDMADFIEFTFTLFFLHHAYSLLILVRWFFGWCGLLGQSVQCSSSCCMSWRLRAYMLGGPVLFSTASAVHRLFLCHVRFVFCFSVVSVLSCLYFLDWFVQLVWWIVYAVGRSCFVFSILSLFWCWMFSRVVVFPVIFCLWCWLRTLISASRRVSFLWVRCSAPL